VAARFTSRVNGLTGAVITRLDILDILPSLKICVAYELDGKRIDYFPGSVTALARCKPVYEEMPGWQTDTTGVRDFNKLPEAARNYVARVEELIACPVNLVCVGPEREEVIEKTPIL
jgi:adenylosuccinate synthase